MTRVGEVDPLDRVLRRTAAAAGRYRVPESAVALAARSLTPLPERGRRDVEVRGLVDAVLHVADSHQPCAGDCGTCDAIRNSLAVALGTVRAEVDVDFQRKMTGAV